MSTIVRQARGLTTLLALQRDAALTAAAVGGALAFSAWLCLLALT